MVSGAASITTSTSASASVDSPGLTCAMPGSASTAATTASASAGLVITTTGDAAPAGNDADRVRRPSTDSARVRKVSSWLSPKPVLRVPALSPASSSTDAAMTGQGR